MASSLTLRFLQKGLPIVFQSSLNSNANVGKWLLGTGGMVVGMIHVGGLTRLTSSGLSMTDWSLTGSLPPMTLEAWNQEFDRYKQYPEWQQRQSMTLSEFQYIYAWEYGHRMLGRVVGAIFLVPWMYFTFRGKIPTGFQPRLIGLGLLGGTQGLVGWWMVKSGLTDDRRGEANQIRVKPVRLASHLTMAFITYAGLIWTGWDILGLMHHHSPPANNSTAKTTTITSKWLHILKDTSVDALRHASRVRVGGIILTSLTGLTIVSGALVAGNDAGRAFNTWPKMGDYWIPPEIFDLSKPYTKKSLDDTATVQFHHRMLGQITGISALALLGIARPTQMLTPQARKGLAAVGIATTAQVVLGITALLNYVPISLAAVHQLGSVVVFTSGLYLVHSLRYARPAVLKQIIQMTVKRDASRTLDSTKKIISSY
jgi:heme a synthase